MPHAATQTISIPAPRDTVLDLVADPARLPEWAPAFAPVIRPDGDDWIVGEGDQELRIHVRVSRELGTVDFLAAAALPSREIGAFPRVVPHGDGGAYTFTQLFPDDMDDAEIERRRATVAEELRTVRALCTEPA
jgi:hypothetical protein